MYGKVASKMENKLTVISLYSGAMGLDLGFELESFETRVAVEKDKWAVATIEANRPSIPVIPKDIKDVSTKIILETARLKVGEATVLIGAPPCEPFSTAGRRNGFEDPRAAPVKNFINVINEAQPQFFVLEEVKGFLRAAKKHISFYERIKKDPKELDPDLRLGSAFDEVMEAFQSTGYKLSYRPEFPNSSVLNAADYGVAQKRLRFILIGSRDGPDVELPTRSHGSPESLEVVQDVLDPWVTLKEDIGHLKDFPSEYMEFPASWGPYLAIIPKGGCWKDLPDDLHKDALGGAYDETGEGLKGGRTGFLRRLDWNRPAPTLVDRPTNRSGCLPHPDLWWRSLSLMEYSTLQGFPKDWIFKGPTSARYRLIGQATPVLLAKAVARAIKNAISSG